MSSNQELAVQEKTIIVDELVDDGGVYQITEMHRIRKSPDNRKRFAELALQELAASIKQMGVAQPILIRPVTPTADAPEDYEIVAGERRYRASLIAGMATIPAMIRKLSDLQAAKIRILENLQREDPHPLEEAEGYQLLMQKHGYNADQLADEVSKSRSYIYGRLKFCSLSTAVREQFLDDKISASIALLIARIPVPSLQARALKEVLIPDHYTEEPLSYRAAAAHIQKRYMLDLTSAIFAPGDAKLIATAGACSKCPKRTGNQPEIFADVSSADVCTDPDCFSEKRAAHFDKLLALADKKGIPVLEDKELDRFNGDRWRRDGDLVAGTESLHYFDRNAPATKNEGTPAKLLPSGALPEPAAYLKDASGEVRPAYKRRAVQAALEAAGFCETVEQHAERMVSANDKDTKQAAKKNAKQEAEELQRARQSVRARQETDYRVALYRKLRQSGAAGFNLSSLREFAKLMVRDDNNYAIPDDLIGDVYPFERATDDAVCDYIDQASLPEVQMILVDLAMGECLLVEGSDIDDLDNHWHAETYRTMEKMARCEGISPEDVRRDLRMQTVELANLGDGEFADFIRVNPQRIDELKDFVVAERPYQLTTLEAAALDNGLEFWQGKFIPVDQVGDAQTNATPANNEADAVASTFTDEDEDAQLAEAMIEAPKPAAKRAAKKSKPAPAAAQAEAPADKAAPVLKVKKADPKPAKQVLSPAAAWPFPKSSTDVLTPATPTPAATTQTEEASA
ncbi:MAG: ParB/RepB/Spo0J family partition protein [Massilia sp.]